MDGYGERTVTVLVADKSAGIIFFWMGTVENYCVHVTELRPWYAVEILYGLLT
jgi:hypothetical protein